LASGLVTAHKLIDNSKVRNPLMVLITDGIPNVPLWTLDAKLDAIQAAEKLQDSKIRFICIGLESNRQYLEKVTQKAAGALYLVDDLNRDNLITIVQSEKNAIMAGGNKVIQQ
jgi:magnesium chelatase subunit D